MDGENSREHTPEEGARKLNFAVISPLLGIKAYEDAAEDGLMHETTAGAGAGRAYTFDEGLGRQLYDPNHFADLEDMPEDFDPDNDDFIL